MSISRGKKFQFENYGFTLNGNLHRCNTPLELFQFQCMNAITDIVFKVI